MIFCSVLVLDFCLFVCLFGDYRPIREFFTHMEMSSLPVKGWKSWTMFDTHGHWAVRVLKSATPTVTWGIRHYLSEILKLQPKTLSNQLITRLLFIEIQWTCFAFKGSCYSWHGAWFNIPSDKYKNYIQIYHWMTNMFTQYVK